MGRFEDMSKGKKALTVLGTIFLAPVVVPAVVGTAAAVGTTGAAVVTGAVAAAPGTAITIASEIISENI